MHFAKLEPQHLEVLQRCRSAEFAPVVEVFRLIHTQTLSALTKADDATALYRLQGRAAVIDDFLQTLEKAPDLLRRAREHGTGRPVR